MSKEPQRSSTRPRLVVADVPAVMKSLEEVGQQWMFDRQTAVIGYQIL